MLHWGCSRTATLFQHHGRRVSRYVQSEEPRGDIQQRCFPLCGQDYKWPGGQRVFRGERENMIICLGRWRSQHESTYGSTTPACLAWLGFGAVRLSSARLAAWRRTLYSERNSLGGALSSIKHTPPRETSL